VTRSATPKLAAYGALAGFALLGALVERRPELAVVSAPFWLVLMLALASVRSSSLRVDVEVDRERAVEGDDVEAAVFYPDDDRWLVDRESRVTHYQVEGKAADGS
jgi:hypothetical protein